MMELLTVATLSLASFAFVASATPGPNNIMLTASGARFGMRRTFPHILGVWVGFLSLLGLSAVGLGKIIVDAPLVLDILRYVGGGYLLYLAYRLLRSSGLDQKEGVAKPLTFGQAAAFQLVNPKAWVMVTTACTLYLKPDSDLLQGALAIVAIFGVVNAPCLFFWTGFGAATGRLLTQPRYRLWFNIGMAALLVFSVASLFIG